MRRVLKAPLALVSRERFRGAQLPSTAPAPERNHPAQINQVRNARWNDLWETGTDSGICRLTSLFTT
jgi:hypothetical protein